jgi:ketosteroid isomerase-like protein
MLRNERPQREPGRGRREVEAFDARDFETFFAQFADDTVYRVAGNNLVSGVYRGMGEVTAFFQHLLAVTEGTMQVDVLDVLGGPTCAAMVFRVRATRQGKSIDDTGTMAFRVNEDGKFAESWLMYSNQAEYDRFFS